jgi:hypothetical protein
MTNVHDLRMIHLYLYLCPAFPQCPMGLFIRGDELDSTEIEFVINTICQHAYTYSTTRSTSTQPSVVVEFSHLAKMAVAGPQLFQQR